LKVYLSTKAQKALENLPEESRNRIESKISELGETPYPPGCKKLRGAPSSYRLRVGVYRILYTLVGRDTIVVFKIAPRGSAYD